MSFMIRSSSLEYQSYKSTNEWSVGSQRPGMAIQIPQVFADVRNAVHQVLAVGLLKVLQLFRVHIGKLLAELIELILVSFAQR